MKFCQPHWDALRSAVEARGLSALVSESGEQAAKNLASELTEGPSIDNFDPLMGAHNAIVSNTMAVAERVYMQSPVIILAEHPDRPTCPICCLNWLHKKHDEECTQPVCNYPKGATYDWMIDRAADDQAEEWRKRGAA